MPMPWSSGCRRLPQEAEDDLQSLARAAAARGHHRSGGRGEAALGVSRLRGVSGVLAARGLARGRRTTPDATRRCGGPHQGAGPPDGSRHGDSAEKRNGAACDAARAVDRSGPRFSPRNTRRTAMRALRPTWSGDRTIPFVPYQHDGEEARALIDGSPSNPGAMGAWRWSARATAASPPGPPPRTPPAALKAIATSAPDAPGHRYAHGRGHISRTPPIDGRCR